MILPLTVKELEIGKLYKGYWILQRNHELVDDVWMQTGNIEDPLVKGQVASLSCFVLLDIKNEKDLIGVDDENYWCRILTKKGEIGWVMLTVGTHWFKELKEETNHET